MNALLLWVLDHRLAILGCVSLAVIAALFLSIPDDAHGSEDWHGVRSLDAARETYRKRYPPLPRESRASRQAKLRRIRTEHPT